MSKISLLCWGVLSLMLGCTAQPEFSIRFCNSPEAECQQGKDQFTLGEEVYVKFEFNETFQGSEVHGIIWRVTESDTIELGDKIFKVQPEDHFIIQDIPFREFGMESLGNFIIRFEDEKERLLAERKISIKSS